MTIVYRGAVVEGAAVRAQTFGHAEGQNTAALGLGSHTEGLNCGANGNYAHSEGQNTYTFGTASHSEGNATSVNGDFAHVEGNQSTANGQGAHAEGFLTSAIGIYSHAEGSYGQSVRYNQHSHGSGSQTISTGSTNPQYSFHVISGGTVTGAGTYVEMTLNGFTSINTTTAGNINVLTVPVRAAWSVSWEVVARAHISGSALPTSNGALFRGDCLVVRGPSGQNTVLTQARNTASGTIGLTAPLYSTDATLDGTGLEVSIVLVDATTHYLRFRGYNGSSATAIAFTGQLRVVELTCAN